MTEIVRRPWWRTLSYDFVSAPSVDRRVATQDKYWGFAGHTRLFDKIAGPIDVGRSNMIRGPQVRSRKVVNDLGVICYPGYRMLMKKVTFPHLDSRMFESRHSSGVCTEDKCSYMDSAIGKTHC